MGEDARLLYQLPRPSHNQGQKHSPGTLHTDLAIQGRNIKGNWIIRVVSGTASVSTDGGGTVADSGETATDSGGSGAMGGEGQPCFPNLTCNAGLTCASRLCVVLPETDEGCSVAGGRGAAAGSCLLLLALVLLSRR